VSRHENLLSLLFLSLSNVECIWESVLTHLHWFNHALSFLYSNLHCHQQQTTTGSKVITVRTRDDGRDNVTYGLEPALYQDGSHFFKIDPKSGDVFLKESLQGQVRESAIILIILHPRIQCPTRMAKSSQRRWKHLLTIDSICFFLFSSWMQYLDINWSCSVWTRVLSSSDCKWRPSDCKSISFHFKECHCIYYPHSTHYWTWVRSLKSQQEVEWNGMDASKLMHHYCAEHLL